MLRAAADIVEDELVVIGSQAILAEHPNAPASLLRSVEVDLYPLTHPERADEIDGALGDGSRFHETYEYYARGVGPETAIAPAGWQGGRSVWSSPRFGARARTSWPGAWLRTTSCWRSWLLDACTTSSSLLMPSARGSSTPSSSS